MSHGTKPGPARGARPDRRRARRRPGLALPGTLTVRAYACGKPNCRCHADPPRLHGPYAEWTRKIGGKTVTRRLTPAELAEYQPLFDNAKKLRALLAELQDLTLEIIEEGSSPGAVNPPNRSSTSGKCGLSPLNLWAATPARPRLPRSAPNVKTSPIYRTYVRILSAKPSA